MRAFYLFLAKTRRKRDPFSNLSRLLWRFQIHDWCAADGTYKRINSYKDSNFLARLRFRPGSISCSRYIFSIYSTIYFSQYRLNVTDTCKYWIGDMSSFDLESPSATSHLTRENSQNAKPVSLRRSVGLSEAIALLVGTIIGSGIFATPKWVLLYVGSVGMSLVMWTVCGLIALFGALCYCELGTLISKSGGEYAYLMEAYGPLPAFLCSYIYVLFVKPSGIMVLLVFGAYVTEPFFPGCGDSKQLVPLVKILAAAALGKMVFSTSFFFRYLKRCKTLYLFIQIFSLFGYFFFSLTQILSGDSRKCLYLRNRSRDAFSNTKFSLRFSRTDRSV